MRPENLKKREFLKHSWLKRNVLRRRLKRENRWLNFANNILKMKD
jgi:hypothetical protein